MLSTPEYQGLVPAKQKEFRDYIFDKDVAPYFRAKGLVADREAFHRGEFVTTPEKLKVHNRTNTDYLGVGTAKGFINLGQGVASLPFRVAQFFTGSMSAKMVADHISEVDNPIEDWFVENPAETTGQALSQTGGEILGQLPGLIAGTRLLNRSKTLAAMSKGKAIPTPKNPTLKAIAGSKLVQQSVYAMADGVISSPASGDASIGKAIEWGAYGGATPVALKTVAIPFSLLKKAFAGVWRKGGPKAAAEAMDAGAGKIKALEAGTTPGQMADDAEIEEVAEFYALRAKAVAAQTGRDVNEVLAEQKEELMTALVNPDKEILVDVAVAEHEALNDLADPMLQALNKQADELAKAAGVKTSAEMVAESAAAQAQRVTARSEIAGEQVVARTVDTLPRDLRGAKPTWQGLGVQFANDIDKAFYIIAQGKKSARDADYLAFLQENFPDYSENELRAIGRAVKGEITAFGKNIESGNIDLPAQDIDAIVAKLKAPMPEAVTRSKTVPKTEAGIKAITDPNVNNYKPALALARAIEQDGEAGAKAFVERHLGRTSKDWRSEKIGDKTAGELYNELSNLVVTLTNAEPQEFGTLFRGTGRVIKYEKLRPGQTVKMPLSSFSTEEAVARIHLDEDKGVLFRVSGPVRAVDARASSLVPAENEIFANGEFIVKNVIKDGDVTIVEVSQKLVGDVTDEAAAEMAKLQAVLNQKPKATETVQATAAATRKSKGLTPKEKLQEVAASEWTTERGAATNHNDASAYGAANLDGVDVLYHTTAEKNVNNILRNGITNTSRDGFIYVSHDAGYTATAADGAQLKKKVTLVIDRSKLPNHEFYYDGTVWAGPDPLAFRTKQGIPKEAIKGTIELEQFKDEAGEIVWRAKEGSFKPIEVPKPKTATPGVKLEAAPKKTEVPEHSGTITAQLEAVVAGRKPAMVLPPGSKVPDVPEALADTSFRFKDGTVVIWNPKSGITLEQVKQAKMQNKLNEILGWPASKQQVAAAVEKGETPVVVTATNKATGAERETVVASTSTVEKAVEAVKKHHPDAVVEVKPASAAEDVIKARNEAKIAEAQGNVLHEYNNLRAQKMLLDFDPAAAKDKEVVKRINDAEAKVQKALAELKASGATDSEIKAFMDGIDDRLKSRVGESEQAFNALKEHVVDKPEPKAATKRAGKPKKSKAAEAEDDFDLQPVAVRKEVRAVLEIEAYRKQGLTKDELEDIFAKHGYARMGHIPLDAAEKIRLDVITAAVRKRQYQFLQEIDGVKLYREILPETKLDDAAEIFEVNTDKILDVDSLAGWTGANGNYKAGYNPTFNNKVKEHYPELVNNIIKEEGTDSAKIYKALHEVEFGGDITKTDEFLRSIGYDVKIQRIDGDIVVQPLNSEVLVNVRVQKAKKVTATARAMGVVDAQVAAVADEAMSKLEKQMAEMAELNKILGNAKKIAPVTNPNNVKPVRYGPDGKPKE